MGFGDGRLPDAGFAQRACSGSHIAMPAVEIANYRDSCGIGRPDPEGRSGDIGVGAEQSISLIVSAFVEQIKCVGMLHRAPLPQYHKPKQ